MAVATETARTLSLVFTDLCGSTALRTEKGDRVAGELIARHRALVARISADSGGRVVDWAGDGCFLTFGGSSSAVLFALRLQQAHVADAALPKVRVGVHMGEITESGGNGDALRVEGLAVDLAARIGALARPGQILLSSAVFDIVRQRLRSEELGTPIEWRAHGAYEFRGIDESVRICEPGILGISPLTPPEGGEKAHRAVTPGEEETLGWRPAVGLNVQRRDNWVLEQQLGTGGFGEVWLAVHAKTKAKRVFKFCFEPERVRGLKREVVLFRLLKETLGNRDDIAQIVDWDFDHSPYFIESEYTEGGDLQAWADVKGGLAKVPLHTRLELVAQTAVALGAAHSVGVLHKDIKPSNVLVSEPPDRTTPRAILTDFGIGLITDRQALSREGITAAGLTETLVSSGTSTSGAGTRMYMAPELIEGRPGTTLSDVYAVGVLLYQIVVGNFRHALAPGWERDIEDSLLVEDIAACVDGNPERRLPGAAELATRLRSLEVRRAAREADARTQRALEKARKRRRQLSVAAAVGISLTVVAGVFALRENQRAGEQASRAEKEKSLRVEAENARQEAEAARAEADNARAAEAKLRAEAEHGKYLADIKLIGETVAGGDLTAAKKRLEATEPKLRGWEWGYFVEKAFPAESTFIIPRANDTKLTAEDRWLGATPQLVGTLTGPTATIFYPLFSADGSRLVVASVRGEAFIWETSGFKQVSSWSAEGMGQSYHARFDRSGEHVVINGGNEARVFEVKSGQEVFRLTGSSERLKGFFEFSPDGRIFCSQNAAGEAVAWDWSTRTRLWTKAIPAGYSMDGNATPKNVGFAPHAEGFVFAADSDTIAVCSLDTGEVLRKVEIEVPEGFYPVDMRADLSRIGYYDPKENQYWFVRFPTGEPLGELWSDPSGEKHNSMTSSEDGTLIALRTNSTTLSLLNAGGAAPFLAGPMPVIEGMSRPVGRQAPAISPDGGLIAVPQTDNSILVFAPMKTEVSNPRNVYAQPDSVSVARFMGTDDELATASFDGTIRTWDLRRGVVRREIKAHEDGITDLAASGDGTRWLTTSYDGTCAVWDLVAGKKLFSSPTGRSEGFGGGLRGPLARVGLAGHPERVFSRDGKYVVMPGNPGGALVLDAGTFEERGKFDDTAYAHRNEFSPDGAVAVAHGMATTARLWDVAEGKLRADLEDGSNFISTAFSPDSERMAAGHEDGRITMWETRTGKKLGDWKIHQITVFTVKFDATGSRLLSSSADATAAIVDAGSGQLLARCEGHSTFVIGAYFNPPYDRILTISLDNTARIWDLQGNEMAMLNVGEGILNGTWSPTGNRIALTTVEGHVFVYDSIPPAELAAAGPNAPLRDQVAAWRAK